MSWNEAKGFGFIAPFAGGKDVFVHASAFSNRGRQPQVQDVVTFSVSTDDRGRLRAGDACYAGEKAKPRGPRKRRSKALGLAIVFLGVLGSAAATGRIPAFVLYACLAASVVTFAAYGIDKVKARHGRWRLEESTLHLLSILGGWPGAIVAQEYLRHKSSKAAFRNMFWITVLLNLAGLAWLLLTEDGRLRLDQVLRVIGSVV